MAFRARGRRARPLRYFVFVSDIKVQMLLDQISEPVRRSIAAELRLDFKLVSLTLTSPVVDGSLQQRTRMAKLAVVEDHLRRYQRVGDLTARRGYIGADAELDWKPLDDNETVLFCGYAQRLLVVLGGSVSHLVGRPPADMQIGSHPATIRAAVHDDEPESGDLGRDLQAVARAVCITPQPVRFLARAISRGPLEGDSEHDEYLLATPLFVEAIDTTGADLEVPWPRER